MDQQVWEFDVEQAIDRLVDHVRNMDYDDLAKTLSAWCKDGVVVVKDRDMGEASAPFRDGRRLRVQYVTDDESPA